MTPNTTIKAEIANLPSDILEYRGYYFLISKTQDGVRVEMTEEEKKLYVERIKAVLDEALSNITIDIKDLKAFDFNLENRTFYAFDDKQNLFNGSYAKNIFKVKQVVVDRFSGKITESSPVKSDPVKSNENPQRPDSSNPVRGEDPIGFEDQKNTILQNFRNPNDQILGPSLALYDQILEEKYNANDNQIRILDPIVIQNNDFQSHPGIKFLIRLFNSEKSLHTIYAPIHLGSSPGRQEGHWIGLALTRKLGTPLISVYDSLGGKNVHRDLAQYIEKNIGPSQIAVSEENVKHQINNSIDCGVHVLNFFDNMEKTKFNGLKSFLSDPSLKIDISNLRKTFADELERNVTEAMFNKAGSYSLRTVKDYHLAEDGNKFVGAIELKKIHQAQLEKFREDINAIRSQHFDWWTFPIKSTSNTYKSQYAVDNATIKQLVADNEFTNNYLASAQLVLAAYGWELKNKDGGYVIEPYGSTQMALPEIRLAKMAESFHLFNRKLYEALVKLSKDHPSIIKVEHPRTVAAFKLDSWTSPYAWFKYLRSFY